LINKSFQTSANCFTTWHQNRIPFPSNPKSVAWNNMLKITVENYASERCFILEGRLTGPWVSTLHQAVMACDADPEAIQINLAAVNFADQPGITLLHELISWGVKLNQMPPLLQALLKLAYPEQR
jgi:hypothetical protein